MTRIMSQATEEIKTKIDLVDLISEYISLKQAGANFKAPCPFHHEKTPSFMVSRPKQIWHCFGCGEGGDIFGFIMKMEGLEFPEALRLLADKAGVKLPAYSSEISSSLRNRLLDILKLAAKFYHKILLESPRAAGARDYLQKRGVSASTIEEWQIGFIPEAWDLLTNFLIKRGYGINDLIASGLTLQKDGGGNYDRFRGRIMFPLADVHGNISGFTGRLLDESKENAGGKYVNTPQTAVYDKSRILFGLDKAKREIKRQDRVIIVEGQMDVLACHAAGQINTAASSGTALTLEQIKLLNRFTNNLYLAFDADAAGQNAAERGLDLALSEGMKVKMILLPADAGKDPDECLKKNPALWFEAVEKARPFMEYFFEKNLAGKDLSKAEDRSAAAQILLTQISKLPDVIEQDFWLKKLSAILDIEALILRERLRSLAKRIFSAAPSSIMPSKSRSIQEVASEQFLSLIFYQENLLKTVADRLKIEALHPSYQKIFQDFVLWRQTAEQTVHNEVIHSFKQWSNSPEVCQMVDVLGILYEQNFANLSQKQLTEQLFKIVEMLNLWYNNNIRRQLTKEMQEAENREDKTEIAKLFKKFKEFL